MQIAIRNGTIVTPYRVFKADILVDGEKITRIGKLGKSNYETFDATGLHIFPGFIDAHVHFRDPGETHKEDFLTGTSAALNGGITTILDMPNNKDPIINKASLKRKLKAIKKKALCDYQLFLGATNNNQSKVSLAGENAAGLKIYFGSSTGSLLLFETRPLLKHFLNFPKNRIIVVHCEDERLIKVYSGRSKLHHENRPVLAAISALAKIIDYARLIKRPVHIAHVTSGDELELIKQAKSEGVPVTCEVTPHHLFLDAGFHIKKGTIGKMNPPLREKGEVEKLWENIKAIDIFATDHAPHTVDEKRQPYLRAPSGIPGLETALPLLLTAVSKGKLRLEDLATKYAESPAKIFGLKNKGEIKNGFDADFCLVNLKERYKIDRKALKTKVRWSPFEGKEVQGKVRATFLRGTLVYQDGEILVKPGFGRLVEMS